MFGVCITLACHIIILKTITVPVISVKTSHEIRPPQSLLLSTLRSGCCRIRFLLWFWPQSKTPSAAVLGFGHRRLLHVLPKPRCSSYDQISVGFWLSGLKIFHFKPWGWSLPEQPQVFHCISRVFFPHHCAKVKYSWHYIHHTVSHSFLLLVTIHSILLILLQAEIPLISACFWTSMYVFCILFVFILLQLYMLFVAFLELLYMLFVFFKTCRFQGR